MHSAPASPEQSCASARACIHFGKRRWKSNGFFVVTYVCEARCKSIVIFTVAGLATESESEPAEALVLNHPNNLRSNWRQA